MTNRDQTIPAIHRRAAPEPAGAGGAPGPAPRRRLPLWLWVLVVAGLLALGLLVCGGVFLYAYGQRPALTPGPSPTIQLLTIPAPSLAPPTSLPATVTGPAPTETQPPTATLPPAPPGTLKIGDKVQVVNTGGVGLSLRQGPGTESPRVAIAIDGEVLEITGGPRLIAGFTWWKLKRSDGVEGWGVQNFLQLMP